MKSYLKWNIEAEIVNEILSYIIKKNMFKSDPNIKIIKDIRFKLNKSENCIYI